MFIKLFFERKTELKIEFKNFKNILNGRKKYVSAVILAAGSSERFGGNKIAYKLNGEPVFIRTLKAFESSLYISEIILVVKKEEISDISEVISEYEFKKLKNIIAGGSTRQESALRGFEASSPQTDYVAIHDGARCLVTDKMIEDVINSAFTYRAATAAHKLTDTVKKSDGNGFIEETLDRDYIYAVSTPQVFLADLYRASAYTAKKADFKATDDCMLAERAGFKVKLVEVGADNIKITYKDDVKRALEILSRRQEHE